MRRARVAAEVARRQFGIRGVPTLADLERVARASGLEVDLEAPFRGRIEAVTIDGVIGLRADLSPGWKKWVLAHMLGHVLLGGEDRKLLRPTMWRPEREGEIFAGMLLWCDWLRPSDADFGLVPPAIMAEAAGVPVTCAASFLHHLAEDAPTEPLPREEREAVGA